MGICDFVFLAEFPRLVDTGFVRFAKQDLESMPEDYNRDFHEWVQNGAITEDLMFQFGLFNLFNMIFFELIMCESALLRMESILYEFVNHLKGFKYYKKNTMN